MLNVLIEIHQFVNSLFQTSYTDPHSKLRYANAEEFARIPYMPSDIVSGYLALRKASGIVG